MEVQDLIYMSELTKPVYKAFEVANMLGVTTAALRVWDEKGRMKFKYSAGGHRLVEKAELIRHLKGIRLFVDDSYYTRRDVDVRY